MSFFDDFLAGEKDFNRKLKPEESLSKDEFPNARMEALGFLGAGTIRPDEKTCSQYSCLAVSGPVLLFDPVTGKSAGEIKISPSSLALYQNTWDMCNSGKYKCEINEHFGATYNCIGWALGISKWLNPNEITAYVAEGLSKDEALKKFIETKREVFKNDHINNFDKIIDKINYIHLELPNKILNNTVAFHFKGEKCTHGARFLETFENNPLGSWTSKLGSNILISHDLQDLMGNHSIYGNELHYASIVGNDSIKSEL